MENCGFILKTQTEPRGPLRPDRGSFFGKKEPRSLALLKIIVAVAFSVIFENTRMAPGPLVSGMLSIYTLRFCRRIVLGRIKRDLLFADAFYVKFYGLHFL